LITIVHTLKIDENLLDHVQVVQTTETLRIGLVLSGAY
jgi:hypothetical protein